METKTYWTFEVNPSMYAVEEIRENVFAIQKIEGKGVGTFQYVKDNVDSPWVPVTASSISIEDMPGLFKRIMDAKKY